MVIVLTIVTTKPEFTEDTHNISCLKFLLKDVLSLDDTLIKKETTIQLTSAVLKLIEKCSLFETWKDQKLLLLFLKFYINSYTEFDWDNRELLSSIYTQILKYSENTNWILNFAEMSVQKFEAQMNTRTFPVEESQKDHWISLEEINCITENENQSQPQSDPPIREEQLKSIQVEKGLEYSLNANTLTEQPEITRIRFSVKVLKHLYGHTDRSQQRPN